MKRGILLLVLLSFVMLVTGCKKTDDFNEITTAKELLGYISEGLLSSNKDKIISSFPKEMHKVLNSIIDEKELKSELNALKKKYGDDVLVDYNIISLEKQSDNWNKHLNDVYSLVYYRNLNIKECYQIKGNVKVSGSKVNTLDNINNTYLCNYDGDYKLLMEI